MRPIAWLVSLTLLFLAIALHFFYIDYLINSNGYIYSLPATNAQREELARRYAARHVQPERVHYTESPTNAEQIALERQYKRKNCIYKGDEEGAWEGLGMFDLDKFECARPYQPPKIIRERIVIPGVTYEAALEREKRDLMAKNVQFGARPSLLLSGDKPSKAMIQRGFWLGVVIPLLLLSGSACVFFMGAWPKSRKSIAGKSHENSPQSNIKSKNGDVLSPDLSKDSDLTVGVVDSVINLRELLKSDFDIDFPISGGTGNSRDNPILIHRRNPNSYVSVESSIINCIAKGRGVEWKLLQQKVMHHNGRTLDQIKVQMTEVVSGEPMESIENYYFDITECVDF